jgi:murein DD-endopeptidase
MSTLSRTAPLPNRRHGLFDTLLAAVLVYGVYATTPWGALAESAVRLARGQKNLPSLVSTFHGRETNVALTAGLLEDATQGADEIPAAVVSAAQTTGIDAALLFAYISVHGTCDASSCTVQTPPELETWLGRAPSSPVSALELADGLSRAKVRFKNEALAVEALFVPPEIIARALLQAESSGAHDPQALESHANFISPGLRRGPLQDAVRVLATHRLRTLAWPVDGKFRITSPFGERIHPVLGTRKFHNGTDVGVPTGTPLLSAHQGIVKRAGRDSVSGLYVIVDHGFGLETAYCHLSEHGVSTSNRVDRRQSLGLSGATGRVTGPHLHYILRVDGSEVDPQAYGEAPRRKAP